METVQNELGRLIQKVVPHLESEVGKGQALEAPVHALSEQLDDITSHMNATPYMTDPAILRTTDATGAQTIGYRDAIQKTEDKELYISFENIFRGSEEMIRNRQRSYLGCYGIILPWWI